MTTTSITPPLASPQLPGLDCFSIEEWQVYYGIEFTPEQIAVVGNFPWNEATLNSPCPFHKGKRVRETHFAFAGLDSITMMELHRLNPKATEPRFHAYADSWYANQKFATEVKLSLRWYLLLKNTAPSSERKTFGEQEAMLPPEYEVPSAVAETAKDLLIFKKTGAYSNRARYARTADLGSDGRRVRVGLCGAEGVYVGGVWGDDRYGYLGVGASRKFDQTLAA